MKKILMTVIILMLLSVTAMTQVRVGVGAQTLGSFLVYPLVGATVKIDSDYFQVGGMWSELNYSENHTSYGSTYSYSCNLEVSGIFGFIKFPQSKTTAYKIGMAYIQLKGNTFSEESGSATGINYIVAVENNLTDSLSIDLGINIYGSIQINQAQDYYDTYTTNLDLKCSPYIGATYYL